MASSVLAPIAVLMALVAGLWLGCQLSKVDDMCSVGRESLQIGAFMMGSARETLTNIYHPSVRVPATACKYGVFMIDSVCMSWYVRCNDSQPEHCLSRLLAYCSWRTSTAIVGASRSLHPYLIANGLDTIQWMLLMPVP